MAGVGMGYPTRQAGGATGGGRRRRPRLGGAWACTHGRGRAAEAIRKNVRRHGRDRLLLICPYSTPMGLRLGLPPGLGSAPLHLALAGGAVGARRGSPRGRDGWV
jgi:hypothetical protein